MKKTFIAYILAFFSAVCTVFFLQLILALCSPVIIDDFAHPERSGLNKPCGGFSEILQSSTLEIMTSLIGILAIFLLVNIAYYKLYISLFTRKISA